MGDALLGHFALPCTLFGPGLSRHPADVGVPSGASLGRLASQASCALCVFHAAQVDDLDAKLASFHPCLAPSCSLTCLPYTSPLVFHAPPRR